MTTHVLTGATSGIGAALARALADRGDRLVLLACGLEVAEGAAHEVLTEPVIRHYYGASVRVLDHPDGGVVVVPTRTDTGSGEPLDATTASSDSSHSAVSAGSRSGASCPLPSGGWSDRSSSSTRWARPSS